MKAFALAAPFLIFTQVAAASPLGDARQLTFEGTRAGEGYFSADGTKMIFQSERQDDNPFYQMYLMDLTTGDVEQVSPGIGKTTCGWIHPAGDRVLFASTQFDPEAQAKMQAEMDFRASGQTRRYAWDYDPAYDLVERDLETGEFRALAPARGYDAEGAYSPDGSRIVFASNRHAYAGPLSAEEEAELARDPSYFMDIYVMNADGSEVTRLTDAPGYDGGSFWSADGARITWRRFSEDGARAEVFTMNADGTDETQLTDMDVMSWAPYFHPSGDYLIFATNLQGFANFELYLVDAEGLREPVRVTDRAGFDGLPTFTPDGAQLSWTSNGTTGRASQIFLADWDHAAALALLADAPLRERAEAPLTTTVAEIDEDDLIRHVAALTAPEMAGRMTGTEGELLATAYVADVFAGLGLKPEGDDGTMFQSFSFAAGIAMGKNNSLGISVDGTDEEMEVETAWRPLAFSNRGEVEATPVAFAGYGLLTPEEGARAARDSYDGLNVAGKWVLVWRGLPASLEKEDREALWRYADMRYKASVAKSRGAIGVIFAPPPPGGGIDGLPKLRFDATSGIGGVAAVGVDRPTAERMLSILGDDLTDMTTRLQAGESVATDLIGVEVAATIDLAFEERSGRNVLARLELDGVEDGLPPLYIGAHVDHLGRGNTSGSLATAEEAGKIHPGADDNASGIAAIIEVAQKLAADHQAGKLDAARDVVFAAWSGEELGLLGVTHFTQAMREDLGVDTLADHVSAYLNLDMVGRMEDRVLVSGLGSSDIWAREIERRNAVIGLPIVTSKNTYLPTDATAFYLAEVPILSLFTGAHGDYHTPRDTPDLLNYDGLRDIARFTALVARSRVMDAEEPAYELVARPQGQGNRRTGGVFLGTIPDYAQDGISGVAISGVVKDGPAEKAGMKGNDVVVGLAGQQLTNIYDYVRTLNGLKPGEPVTITVKRDGEEQVLEIVPGVRN